MEVVNMENYSLFRGCNVIIKMSVRGIEFVSKTGESIVIEQSEDGKPDIYFDIKDYDSLEKELEGDNCDSNETKY